MITTQDEFNLSRKSTLGVRIHLTSRKCHKCDVKFTKHDKIYIIKGSKRKHYHQLCWDEIQQ